MASRDDHLQSDQRTSVPYNLQSYAQQFEGPNHAQLLDGIDGLAPQQDRPSKAQRRKGALVVSQTEYLVSYASNGTSA